MGNKSKYFPISRICTAVMVMIMTAVLIIPGTIETKAAELMVARDYSIYVDNGEISELTVGAYTNGYDNKIFLSLTDLARVLSGTSKQFNFAKDIENDIYTITTGTPYEEPTTEPETAAEEETALEPETNEGDYYDEAGNLYDINGNLLQEAITEEPLVRPDYEYLELYMNPLTIDGSSVRYYTYQLSALSDIYMNVIDIELALDITIEKETDSSLNIYTDRGWSIDISQYEQDGFFDLSRGVIVGDATTGEILYGYKENNLNAIASTSKLMTYLITARYIELGKISMDDVVTISEECATLAQSGNGTLYMDIGQQITVRELIAATLIASSNESAMALAEYIAGSEDNFVVMMNEMAQILGLSSAKFVNSNGLPDYSDSVMASRRQNQMTAADLFKLSSVILRKYPEITEFTSCKEMYLSSFDYTISNTSQLLNNMPNAIGLKTGTTDEADCCLVGAIKVSASDGEHILVAVVLGAESNIDRYQVPEVLLTWAKNQLQ